MNKNLWIKLHVFVFKIKTHTFLKKPFALKILMIGKAFLIHLKEPKEMKS